jgi:hypothetical protein
MDLRISNQIMPILNQSDKPIFFFGISVMKNFNLEKSFSSTVGQRKTLAAIFFISKFNYHTVQQIETYGK